MSANNPRPDAPRMVQFTEASLNAAAGPKVMKPPTPKGAR